MLVAVRGQLGEYEATGLVGKQRLAREARRGFPLVIISKYTLSNACPRARGRRAECPRAINKPMSPPANRFIVASFAFHAAAAAEDGHTAVGAIMAVTSRALTSKIDDLAAVINALWLLPSVTSPPEPAEPVPLLRLLPGKIWREEESQKKPWE